MLAPMLISIEPARANWTAATRIRRDGVVLWSKIFHQNGGFAIDGLLINDNPNNGPMVFFCRVPNTKLLAVGETKLLATVNFIKQYPQCFNYEISGILKITINTSEKGLIFGEKNIASCGCEEGQIDHWLMDQACKHRERCHKNDSLRFVLVAKLHTMFVDVTSSTGKAEA